MLLYSWNRSYVVENPFSFKKTSCENILLNYRLYLIVKLWLIYYILLLFMKEQKWYNKLLIVQKNISYLLIPLNSLPNIYHLGHQNYGSIHLKLILLHTLSPIPLFAVIFVERLLIYYIINCFISRPIFYSSYEHPITFSIYILW